MKYSIQLILHSVALIAISVLIVTHAEYEGLHTILFALVSIAAGYRLGSWTCHLHQRERGLWITIGIFVLLNTLHSTIDGASIGTVDSLGEGVALLSHEFARQPALYIVLWGMLTPFRMAGRYRYIIAPLVVTGTWLLGTSIGYSLFHHIENISWLEPIADMAIYLFLGDILHHFREEYAKTRRGAACCHDRD